MADEIKYSHHPKIKLKTKVTDNETTPFSEIDLSQGEPLVDTNTKTVIIGTKNGIKANSTHTIQLGNSYQVVNNDIENGAVISHIDAGETRSNIFVYGIEGIEVTPFSSGNSINIGTNIVGKNGVIVESDKETSKLTISVEGVNKTDDGTNIVDSKNIHMEVGSTEVDVNNNGVTLNTPLTVSSGGTGRNDFTNNALIVGDGSSYMDEIPTEVGALYVDENGGNAKFGTLPINRGGTGATTQSKAIQNLGITATASELNKLDGATVSTTEINTLKGIEGNIQTQLDGKAPTEHGTHVTYSTSLPTMNGTANVGKATAVSRADHIHPTDTSRASTTEFNAHTNDKENPHEVTLKQLGVNVSADKINYLDGVSSNVQTQLNSKAPKSHASSGTTYGLGTTSTYGHVKISNGDVATTSTSNGVAAGMGHTHGDYLINAFSDTHKNDTEGTVTISDSHSNKLILKAGENVNLSVGTDNTVTISTSGEITGTIESAKNVTSQIKGTAISNIFNNSMEALKAVRLTSNAGSAVQPIYFSDGKPVACTYTLNKTVPSNAVFTDTHYTSKMVVTNTSSSTTNATTALTNSNVYLNVVENGIVRSSHKLIGNGATTVTTNSSGHIIISSTDTNTTYGAAGTSLGLVKSGGDVTISSGIITVNDDSHNHVISNVDGLQSALDSKQPTITGAATTITNSNLTANKALISDSSGKVGASSTTSTEIGYVHGVKSAIQDQIDGKANKVHNHLYAASDVAGGSATSSKRLDSTSIGSSTVPCYINSSGVPVACTSISLNADTATALTSKNIGTATKGVYFDSNGLPQACSYNVYKEVPSSAVFTDYQLLQKTMQTNSTSTIRYPLLLSASHVNSTATEFTTTAHRCLNISATGEGTLYAKTFSGSGASLTNLNASNLSTGTIPTERLATSGVTANSYGPSSNTSPSHGGTFTIPYITVDTYGRVTAASNKTITLPTDNNTDTKNTAGSTSSDSKLFLIGATSQASNPVTYSNSAVYMTKGTLTATAFSGQRVDVTSSVTAPNFYATSDRRKKTNICDYTPERSILDLQVKEFDYIDSNEHTIGCIADELMEIEPKLVHEDKDGYLQISETKLVYLLLDEVKKLRKELDNLKRGC